MTNDWSEAVNCIFQLACQSSQPNHVEINYSDIQYWPAQIVESLQGQRLIKPMTSSSTIDCQGCEERCSRPVTQDHSKIGSDDFVISTCHLHEELGPFRHPIELLARWSTSRKQIADFVKRKLSLTVVDTDKSMRRVRFRPVSIDNERRAISLEFRQCPDLLIGSTSVQLRSFLFFDAGQICFDQHYFRDCFLNAHDVLTDGKSYQASRTVQESNKLATELRDQKLQRRLDELARKHPGRSKAQLAKLIARDSEFPNVGISRIMRVTRMPNRLRKKS